MKSLKKFLAVILSAATMLSAASVSAFAVGEGDYDLNGDGKFDVLDVTHLQLCIAGNQQLSESAEKIADYNGDGKIDVLDVTQAQILISSAVTPPNPDDSNYNRAYADRVIELVNNERAKAGISPLQKDVSISALADIRSKELTTLYSHQRPDGTNCITILDEYNVPWYAAGENIAAGFSSPEKVVEGWMNSPGHRANILNPDYNKIGVSCYIDRNSEYTYYWEQLFIGDSY